MYIFIYNFKVIDYLIFRPLKKPQMTGTEEMNRKNKDKWSYNIYK